MHSWIAFLKPFLLSSVREHYPCDDVACRNERIGFFDRAVCDEGDRFERFAVEYVFDAAVFASCAYAAFYRTWQVYEDAHGSGGVFGRGAKYKRNGERGKIVGGRKVCPLRFCAGDGDEIAVHGIDFFAVGKSRECPFHERRSVLYAVRISLFSVSSRPVHRYR